MYVNICKNVYMYIYIYIYISQQTNIMADNVYQSLRYEARGAGGRGASH